MVHKITGTIIKHASRRQIKTNQCMRRRIVHCTLPVHRAARIERASCTRKACRTWRRGRQSRGDTVCARATSSGRGRARRTVEARRANGHGGAADRTVGATYARVLRRCRRARAAIVTAAAWTRGSAQASRIAEGARVAHGRRAHAARRAIVRNETVGRIGTLRRAKGAILA
jgi:hypothetical protein